MSERHLRVAYSDGSGREVTAEELLDCYEAEIASRGIPPVAGAAFRAARLSLVEGTIRRLCAEAS